MTAICIIGGKLQGFEVTYLARQAGIKVLLIDRNEKALIRHVVDRFHCFDIMDDPERLIRICEDVDAVLPVNENPDTLEFIKNITADIKCPVLFDHDAYHISRDKNLSADFFKQVGIPTPENRPSKPPYFVKPPCLSSSVGTRIIYDERELEQLSPDMVVEEYVPGDVISLEVIGDGNHFAVVKETKVHIDDTYDCTGITPIEHHPQFREIAHTLAKKLGIRGIMDVEAIASKSGPMIIEIDARFPSQTPIVVYHSSGINLVELLLKAFKDGVEQIDRAPDKGYCILEHLLEVGREPVPVGEHILSRGEDYREYYREQGLEIFKCSGRRDAYTLICYGEDESGTLKLREKAVSIIKERME